VAALNNQVDVAEFLMTGRRRRCQDVEAELRLSSL
jgi:hypothetical protein